MMIVAEVMTALIVMKGEAGNGHWHIPAHSGEKFSLKTQENIWNGLIRPHLEYVSEILDEPRIGDSREWREAETVMNKMGGKLLRCSPRTSTEAVRGDLGWETMSGRRMSRRVGQGGTNEERPLVPKNI